MKCQRPIDVSVKTGGLVYHNKYGMPVQSRGAFLVPCGKCLACKSRRKSEIVFRLDAERRFGHFHDGEVVRYKHCFFVTLTYAPDFLPRYVPTLVDYRTGEVFDSVEVDENHTGLLSPIHLRDFYKRLRRYYGLDCKALSCGEYGDEKNRPHYHLIFFSNLNWEATRNALRHAWSMKCPKERLNTPGHFVVNDGIYKTNRFVFGRVDVKPVNIRRIRYCAKYVLKDENNPNPIPCFHTISKKLGLGWLVSEEARSTRSNHRLFAFLGNGSPSSIGRYFTHRIFTKEQLKNCVDEFIQKFETPPELDEFGENYRLWYDEHIAQNNALYRAYLARAIIPQFCHV